MTIPVAEKFGWKWLRRNLFATPFDFLLTIVFSVLVASIVWKVSGWAIIDANFAGTSREDCTGGGACWVFVKERIWQFVYGFYNESERWRPNIVFILYGVSHALYFAKRVPKKPLTLIIAFVLPVISFVLLRGGWLGLSHVETTKWGGLLLTLVVAYVSICLSLPLGVMLALGRRSTLPVVRMFSVAFIEFGRGVPLITVLFMASVMLPLFFPPGFEFDKLMRCLIGITLFASAYIAEVVRGGLQAIPKGQYEASKALGFGYWPSMTLIILPQALKKVIPGVVNTFIGLFKDTTLVLIVGMFDLLGMVQAAATDPQWLGFAMEGYVFAGLVFWVFCYSISRISQRIETQLNVEG
jgi:general L-amino acid transport system permease protein